MRWAFQSPVQTFGVRGCHIAPPSKLHQAFGDPTWGRVVLGQAGALAEPSRKWTVALPEYDLRVRGTAIRMP